MTGKMITPGKWLLMLLLLVSSVGCMAAAAAAGAGAGIYLTSRGAESIVEGSIEDVSSRARSVLNEEGIALEDSESAGEERQFKGKKGELDVTVDLKRESSTTTRVEVAARENVAEWDKEYAQQLLSRIVQKD
ncbi:MAG TPA: DUF3568 family protein [Gemmatimonadales bacterium]|nr:DUF3568 family protein [Gemmatimonadales bacterium]